MIGNSQPASWVAYCTFVLIPITAIGILNFVLYMEDSIEKTLWFMFGISLLIVVSCIASAVILIECYMLRVAAGLREELESH